MKLNFIFLFFALFLTILNAQEDKKWGQFSQEEINLSDVSFEPGASAVILHEEGELSLTNNGYEIIEYSRIKILNSSGYSYAVLERSYNPQDYNSNVELIKGQTINFVNGKSEITEISKNDIFTENKNPSTNVLRVIFPKIKEGSIIEYKLKIKSPADLYSSPWRFQNRIPTLKSKLKLKNLSAYDYRVIQYGKLLLSTYGNAKGRKDWELLNIPSLDTYTNVYNANDYADRIMIQHSPSSFQHGTYTSATNWVEFKKKLNNDIKKSINNVNFNEISIKIKNGINELETISNCIQYIRDNYKWKNQFSFVPYNLNDNLLREKSGYSADLNILLNGILKSKNIDAELILNSGRSNGKMLLNYPAFSRIQAIENLVKLKSNETILLDAALSDPKNVKFLDINMYNQYVLIINQAGDSFIILEPPLSEMITINQFEFGSNKKLNLKSKIKYNGYFKDYPPQNFEFEEFNSYIINETPIKEIDGWKTNAKLYTLQDKNLGFVEINCPLKNQLEQYQFDVNRNYPLEINFPHRLIVQSTIKKSQYNEILYDNFDQEINAFEGRLTYKQSIETKDDLLIATWILSINKSLFSTDELSELKKFITEFDTATNNSIILKN